MKASCAVTVMPLYPTAIKLNITSNEIYQGEHFQLEATLGGDNAKNNKIKWTSSDQKVAYVFSDGRVEGLEAGKATITAETENGQKAVCKVTVKKVSVSFSPSNATMHVGDTLTVEAKFTLSTFSPTLKWTSSNPDIATVNNKGEVTALKPGEVYIALSVEIYDIADMAPESGEPFASDCQWTVEACNITIEKSAISGECGNDTTWVLEPDGNLLITGSGKMKDYTMSGGRSSAPWSEYSDEIRTVEIRGISYIGYAAFYALPNLEAVYMDDSVTRIAFQSFEDCSSLKNVVFSKNLNEMGGAAFAFCTSLSNVKLHSSLVKIADEAFYDCEGLEQVYIPSEIEVIGNRAFAECHSLETVTLHEGSLMEIGDYAFKNTRIERITLPTGVTKIGSEAFMNCRYMKRAVFSGTVTKIGKYAFGYFETEDGIDKSNLKIYCFPGSAAEQYAIDNGLDYNSNLVANG